MDERMNWDELFMSIVCLYAQMSRCKHFKVGVIFARDKRILTAGYNGPPKKKPHCTEIGCAKEDDQGNRLLGGSGKCRGAHAETNAIANAAKEGIILESAIVYCTYSPCYDCSKVLINLGIKEYVYLLDYGDDGMNEIKNLEDSGIIVRKFSFHKKGGE